MKNNFPDFVELLILTNFTDILIFETISGEKISPIEVDAVLLSHPDVAQAVAFGVPDDKYGEEVRKPFCLKSNPLE